jgi:integrase
MASRLLTAEVVASEGPAKADRIVRDTKVPGFGLSIRKSGRKGWSFQFRNQRGEQRKMGLGPVDRVTLAQARKEARRLLGQVDNGRDPLQEKRDRAAAAAAEKDAERLTFAVVADEWFSVASRKLRPKTLREYRRQLDRRLFPVFGTRGITSIEAADLQAYHEEAEIDSPLSARQDYKLCRQVLKFAKRKQYVERDVGLDAIVDLAPDGRDPRALSSAEIGRLLRVCREMRDEGGRDGRMACAFHLMLLTGMRPSEVYALRWDQVDFEGRRIKLPVQKNKSTEPVEIGGKDSAATRLLLHLAEERDVYVFSGTREGSMVGRPGIVWKKVHARAKLAKGLTPKHLRKTFVTQGLANGIAEDDVAALTRHDPKVMRVSYADRSQLRKSAQADTLMGAIEKLETEPAEVVELRQGSH